MTNKQIVSSLREMGHDVKVYVRKDGSIRVVELDGQKFKANFSEGVQAARSLYYEKTNAPKEEIEAYQAVKSQRAVARHSLKSGFTLKSQSKEFQTAFKKLQAKVRRINKRLAKEGKHPKFGVNWHSIKAGAMKSGIRPEQQLKRAADYFAATSQGIAPQVLVNSLLARLYAWDDQFPELIELESYVEANQKHLDIIETKKTIDWVYGYVKRIRQSETLEDRLNALKRTLHI